MYNLVESRISKPVVCVLTSELCILGCDENLARYSWIEPLQASWSPLAAQYKADSVLLERTFGRSEKIAGKIAIFYTVLAQCSVPVAKCKCYLYNYFKKSNSFKHFKQLCALKSLPLQLLAILYKFYNRYRNP